MSPTAGAGDGDPLAITARSWRYRNLTLGLFLVLLMPPLLRTSFPGAAMIAPAVFAVLVGRAMVIMRPGGVLRAVMISAMAAVALRGVRVDGMLPIPSWGLAMTLDLLTVAGFTFVMIEVFRHVLAAGPVDANKLYAAVAAYLLLGLTFASVYETLLFWKPDAFVFSNGQGDDPDALMYFSLVTLCTVGYGDILPGVPEARVLAVLEATLGQLYLAVLMARLVGLNLNQSGTSAEPAMSSPARCDLTSNSPREAP